MHQHQAKITCGLLLSRKLLLFMHEMTFQESKAFLMNCTNCLWQLAPPVSLLASQFRRTL